jgi:chaperonin GroEL (HSP60 family)
MAVEGSDRNSGPASPSRGGTDVLRRNITAGKLVGDIVGSTLGPCGRDVLLYDRKEYEEEDTNHVEVTNSGAFVLKRLVFGEPAAGVVARIAKAQDERCGDGTTTTALYAGQMLAEAEELLDQGLHPTSIVKGVNEAVGLAGEAIEGVSRPVDDVEVLESIVRTTLSGRLADVLTSDLCEWIDDAVAASDGEKRFSRQSIQTESLRAGNIGQSELVRGFVLKKSFAGRYDPVELDEPRIGLAMQGLARKERIQDRLETGDEGTKDLVFKPSDPEGYEEFAEHERALMREQLAGVVAADVDVLIVSNRVEDDLLSFFDDSGIAVVREADRDRLEAIADATGATINKYIQGFSPEDVGYADRLEQRSYPEIDQNAIFLRGCPNGHVASVLVHGSTWASSWEAERNVNNAVAVADAALKHDRFIPGGGATEMEIGRFLRDAATERGGREALAIEAVADAVEVVPRTLARNAGMNPLDAMVDLRTAHHHGETHVGVLPIERTTGNVLKDGVCEVAFNKRNAIQAAGSIVTTILRIDDTLTGIGPDV